MSLSTAHTDAFVSEALQQRTVWTIRDDGGIAAAVNADGKRAMPFWSAESRVRTLIADVDVYSGFRQQAIGLATWRERWLPDLEAEGMLVGLNWSGDLATGADVSPADVLARLELADR